MSAVIFDYLSDIDERVQSVAKALNGSIVEDLVNASADLQLAVNQFHAFLQRSPSMLSRQPQVLLQVNKAAAALASVQENLARRSVITQQTLQTLIPTVRAATYGVGMGARTRQPYGSAGQRSGEFKVAVA